MKFRLILQNAYLALRQNIRRSLLTMVGIIIGVSAVITILSLGNGFKAYTMKNLTQPNSENVGVEINFMPNEALSTEIFFNESDLRLAENVAGVDSAEYVKRSVTMTVQDFYFGTAQYTRPVGLVERTDGPMEAGRNLTSEDNEGLEKTAIISSEFAQKISTETNDVLGYGLTIDNQLYTVVGIFPGGVSGSSREMQMEGEGEVKIPKKTYEFFNSQGKSVSAISVKVESGYKPSAVADKVVDSLTENGFMAGQGSYASTNMTDFLDGISNVLSTLTLFISGIAGISLFIAGVGVMNMMYTSVSERTQEIGVRRAMGAKKSDIRQQFLAEGLLLTISSGIIGYVIGYLIALMISQFLPFRVAPDLFTIALSVGITTALGLIFSVAPANAAARKDLVEILR
jgi:putative ABC transport system permease protein